ncbi:MAG TPA: TonB-dependent receptor, partial [Pirellulaceae bacterium]|nr:TonB-dependent receptor [Pirellulaceae bacterium]
HDENRGERWALDFGVRMVKAQNQLGLLRLGTNMNDVSGVIPAELSTPGFAVSYLRGYYDVSKNLHLIGGVENLFDRAYFEHLDLRLPNQGSYTNTTTYSPGVTPYLGVVWTL